MPGMRFLSICLVCVAAFSAVTNASIIDGGTSYYSTPPPLQEFTDGGIIAEIQCNVYTYDSGAYAGKYGYTYQLFNTSTADLNFLSMQINNDGLDISDYGVDVTDSEDVIPRSWELVDPPSDSFNGHFNDKILSGEQSALLWFVSDYAPMEAGGGYITGTYANSGGPGWTPFFAVGELIIPSQVPEPATFLLISMGTFAIIGRRRGVQRAS